MDREEYQRLRKEGIYNHYIWKWSKNKETPDDWLTANPIKIFGFCLGWRVEVVKNGYEKIFFTK